MLLFPWHTCNDHFLYFFIYYNSNSGSFLKTYRQSHTDFLVKTNRSTRLTYTGLCGELEHLKIESRLIVENFGCVMTEWVCDLEDIWVSSIFKTIRRGVALTRMLTTLDLRCEENVTWRKWKLVWTRWTPEVVSKWSFYRWFYKNKVVQIHRVGVL
jgi:hypothetical protein